MVNLDGEVGKREVRKRKRSGQIFLSSRDVKVLEFILEMKFSNLDNVFDRFFKVTLSGDVAKSNEWAIRRIQQLVKAGFLVSTYSFYEPRKYYLVSEKGCSAISRAHPEKDVLRPLVGIDQRTFEHDKRVLQTRILLENSNEATFWISDRQLRTNASLAGGLTSHNVPDAIYVDSKGEKVAFEFEQSQKSKADYRDKLKKQLAIMRSTDPAKISFQKVIYVCIKSGAFEFLKSETRIYGNLFEILRASDLDTGKETSK